MNNLLGSVFIASDLAGLFVQSVATAVLPVAALAPQAQVAQMGDDDILQPCPARAARRAFRLTLGACKELQSSSQPAAGWRPSFPFSTLPLVPAQSEAARRSLGT